MNKVFLIGRMSKEPDLRTTNSGLSKTTFTLAVDKRKKEDGADFINCLCWRGTADNVAKYTKKGSMVAVFGSIQTRSYDAADGTKRHVTEVLADEVQFLSKGENGSGQRSTNQASRKDDDKFGDEVSDFTPLDEDDSLPF